MARGLQSSALMESPSTAAPIDGVLLVGLAACAGGLAWAAPLETALASALVLVALARRGRPIVALGAALAFLVTAARGAGVVSAYEAERASVVERARWPVRCVLVGEVAR